uniref:Uncharacterized protein n=1 Tax=Romanomermis culicivorax TaxID=13658 RepID=A0A915IHN9_ROMCU
MNISNPCSKHCRPHNNLLQLSTKFCSFSQRNKKRQYDFEIDDLPSGSDFTNEVPRASSPVADEQHSVSDLHSVKNTDSTTNDDDDDNDSIQEESVRNFSSEHETSEDDEIEQEALWLCDKIRCKLSKEDFACLLLFVQRRFRITDVALTGILKIFKLALPESNSITNAKSLIKLAETVLVDQNQDSAKIIKICEDCKTVIVSECNLPNCGLQNVPQLGNEFITHNVENQIANILRTHGAEIFTYWYETGDVDLHTDIVT